MKYTGSRGFTHQQADKVGVLITNLGTPAAPTKQALKPYLKQFLSDPRVVEVPRLLWWMILNLIILNIRPARSAKAYATVWTEKGSPLLEHTQNQRDALAEKARAEFGEDVIVEFAMRYGQPGMDTVLDKMMAAGVRKLVVVPLYPQYCASTTASTFDALAQDFMQRRWMPELRFVTHYHDNSDYIDALAASVRAHWDVHGRADKLVMSYHGIPKRYLLNGDPYHCECYKTSRLLAEALGLSKDEYMTTFQSRFGREEWLTPYTDETMKALPGQGVTSVQVICPGFSADCLETIEEIGEENCEYFMESGGKTFSYIPALNASAPHIDTIWNLVKQNLQGWDIPSLANQDYTLRASEANKYGADK